MSAEDPGVKAETEVDRDAETAGDPIPQEEGGQTVVGKNLSELIDEIEEEHRQFTAAPSAKGGGDKKETGRPSSQAAAVDELISADEKALENELESAAPSKSPPSDEEISPQAQSPRASEELVEIMREELEPALRSLAQRITAARDKREKEQVEQRIQSLKQAATQRLRNNANKLRKLYGSEHHEKERQLRERYERLMKLAKKISQQKAELKQARAQLDAKLRDAHKIHQELKEIGQTMSKQIGGLEGIVEDDDEDTPSSKG
ncbi:MAG: hypothetical protein GWN84_21485 [Gammaproteobacteria bacterium]|nr:hypothetical protein [Gammaproteobacteria bacterium]NIR85295.1 hypothetical protein [Gammaproteobacteria bacterium]NIR88411.1 hypothetical protein [Gammaproteobacteria bacterium]NIU06361.1 hypothetical protein [Gammaproteobacteria bacterium]NIV53260.1 hypothetical protein [Gammaproteobacteria bacterium]